MVGEPRLSANEWARMAPTVVLELLGEPTRRSSSQWRYGRHGSLSVDVRRGRWHDFEADEGGGVWALVVRELGSPGRALEWLRERGLVPGDDGRTVRRVVPVVSRPVEPATPRGPDLRSELAQEIWEASRPADSSLGRAYLAARRAWPPVGAGPSLPPSVRWLAVGDAPPARDDDQLRWYGLPVGAAGALVFGYGVSADAAPGPACDCVSLLAVRADAIRVGWFASRAKVRDVGPRLGRVFEARAGAPGGPEHVVEGEVDALALALAPWAPAGRVAGGLGTAFSRYKPLGSGGVRLHVDADRPGRTAALRGVRALRERGFEVQVEWYRCGDPAETFAKLVVQRTTGRVRGGQDPQAASFAAWNDVLAPGGER